MALGVLEQRLELWPAARGLVHGHHCARPEGEVRNGTFIPQACLLTSTACKLMKAMVLGRLE